MAPWVREHLLHRPLHLSWDFSTRVKSWVSCYNPSIMGVEETGVLPGLLRWLAISITPGLVTDSAWKE